MPKKIRDPIHNYIHLDDAALEVVDTPKFQRLRRIHQLGTAHLVYPGANHTRFEHSLGAYHLASEAARAMGLSPSDAREVALAALLHDVGHGPFSHVCDAIYQDHLGRGHARISQDLLRGSTALREAVARHGASPDRVAALIGGEGPLGGLVSGDLDVDRMDYLVRDSHYTGVRTGVDLERLVTSLVLTPQGLALREGALAAAEMLLVTRFMMYSTVYLHHTCRVAEVMVERAMRLAIEAGEIQPKDLPNMDDLALTYLLRHSKTDAWRLMLAVDHRRLLKTALEASADRLGEESVRNLSTDPSARAALERAVAERAGAPAGDILFDVPPMPLLPGVDVRIVSDGGPPRQLAERSLLVATLTTAQRDHWRARVLCPASRREAVARAAAEVLEEEFGPPEANPGRSRT